jgi:hypothetical protein
VGGLFSLETISFVVQKLFNFMKSYFINLTIIKKKAKENGPRIPEDQKRLGSTFMGGCLVPSVNDKPQSLVREDLCKRSSVCVKSMPCYLDKQERPRASLCVFHSTVLDML